MRKNKKGFTLIETLVAIVVLALIVIPTCSGIILSYRINARAEDLLQGQLAVASAAEHIIADGYAVDAEEIAAIYPGISIVDNRICYTVDGNVLVEMEVPSS